MRQMWFHFAPGVGGDGLVNLLEHAWSVKPIDHRRMWRIHRVVDDQVKFWAAAVDYNGGFRTSPIKYKLNDPLVDTYIQNIRDNVDMVIASHDVTLTMLDTELPRELLLCQENILIKTKNPDQAWCTGKIKNLTEMDLDIFNAQDKHTFSGWADYHADVKKFDHVFYIEDILQSWKNFIEFLNTMKLNIDRPYYDQYQQLIAGNIFNFNIDVDHYSSYIENNKIKYNYDRTTKSLSNKQ